MAAIEGKTIGKYRILERLGRGGMAEVFKGYQAGLDRYVAIKVLHAYLADEKDFVGRFQREARAVAALRHPNIVQVFDFDVEHDLYYMVMEYIDGPTLKALLKEFQDKGEAFPPEEIIRIFKGLGAAIDYAHSRGMVHRDIKPANIMFNRQNDVVLTDFGIAYIVGAARFTMTGAVSGTPAYMSPEQGMGQGGDERSDIYSLGIILYEVMTGRVPFEGDTPFSVIMKHLNEPLPLPSHIVSAIRPAVERVILKSLSKNPDDRYQTGTALAQALDAAFLATSETLVEEEPPVSKVAPRTLPSGATVVTTPPARWAAQPPVPPERIGRVAPVEPARPVEPPRRRPGWVLPLAIVAVVVLCAIAAAASYFVYPKLVAVPTETATASATPTLTLTPVPETATLTAQPAVTREPSPSATAVRPTESPVSTVTPSEVRKVLTPTSAPTKTPTKQIVAKISPTATLTIVPKQTPTKQVVARVSPSATATSIPTQTATQQVMVRVSPTATATSAPTPTATREAVVLPSPTATATGMPVEGATQVALARLSPTATSVPPATPTPVVIVVTATPTDTPLPTDTLVPTDTPVPTDTATPTPPATPTPIIIVVTATPTDTPVPTDTAIPTITATDTPVPTATDTPLPMATDIPVPTATDTLLPTATDTPLPTATDTPLPTATDTPAPTATNTPIPPTPTFMPLVIPTDTPAAPKLTAPPLVVPTDTPGLPKLTAPPLVAPTETPMGSIPTVSGLVMATDTPQVAVKPTTSPKPGTARRPASCGPITNFDDFGNWKRGQEANGTFTQTTEQVHGGAFSGKLTYNFPGAGNDYVVFLKTYLMGGRGERITAWVYGDGSGHFLNCWIKDAAGETWQFTFGQIRHTGWQQMTASLDPGLPWPNAHVDGPSNGAVDYPIDFRGLVLDDAPDEYVGRGVIYIAELACAEGAGAPPPVQPTEGVPVPGGTLVAPKPVQKPPAGPPAKLAGHLAWVVFKPGMSKATYDIYVSNLDGTDQRLLWQWGRQPKVRRWDGRTVFNADGQGKDNLWVINLDGSDAREISQHPEDAHPNWSPKGDRLLFDSEFYTWGAAKAERIWTVWVQNDVNKPAEPLAVNVADRVIPGRSPVWLENDWVVYTGCNFWENGGSCGLYTAPSWGIDKARQLTTSPDDAATDTIGNRVVYNSRQDGNWEVYAMNFDGGGKINLTNNPANDGLGTFSPDGTKVAFISDRGGVWAIWVMNADGSGQTKLFDLPGPMGPDWTTERISWGP